MDLTQLIEKYGTTGPRYTSYPTAPQWKQALTAADYGNVLSKADTSVPLALYVHIPFCEQLCYYCGCNIQITKDKGRSGSYLLALKRETEWVASQLPSRAGLAQISWGGGTPTFLTPAEISHFILCYG